MIKNHSSDRRVEFCFVHAGPTKNSLDVLFSSGTAPFGILRSNLDFSEQTASEFIAQCL